MRNFDEISADNIECVNLGDLFLIQLVRFRAFERWCRSKFVVSPSPLRRDDYTQFQKTREHFLDANLVKHSWSDALFDARGRRISS